MMKSKKLRRAVAIILSLLMLVGVMPENVALYAAAENGYKTVEVVGKTIYLYGADSIGEVEEAEDSDVYNIPYIGGSEFASAVYVGGKIKNVTEAEIRYQSNNIQISKSWIEEQNGWIAIKIAENAVIPEEEPGTEKPTLDDLITIKNNSGTYKGESIKALDIQGKKESDEITYIVNGKEEKEEPIIEGPNGDGIKVQVKIVREGYQEYVSEEYIVKITEGKIDWIEITPFNDTYNSEDASAKHAVTIKGKKDEDVITYTYEKAGETITSNESPIIENVGSLEVTVKVSRDKYEDLIKTVMAVMKPARIQGIEIIPNDCVYDGEEHPVVKETRGLKEGDVVLYSEDGTNYVEYDETKYTIKNAGQKTFYIKVERTNHTDYITMPPITAKISKAKIDEKDVTIECYAGTEYDGEEHNALLNVSSNNVEDTFRYKINDREYTSEITNLKVKDAGKYTVYVEVTRNNNYETKVLSKEIVIGKANPEFSFENDTTEVYYTASPYNIFECKAKSKKNDATGNITYEIDKESIEQGVECETETGKITYKIVGKVTVTATIAEDDNYTSASVLKTVEIKYATLGEGENYKESEPVTTIDGIRWYDGTVNEDGSSSGYILTAPRADEEDGWLVAESNSLDVEFEPQIMKNDSSGGKYENFKVAFKNKKTGQITDMVSVDPFAVDNMAPEIVGFDFAAGDDVPDWLNMLTFGLVGNKNVTIKVYFEDLGVSSGVDNIKVYTQATDKTSKEVYKEFSKQKNSESFGTEKYKEKETEYVEFTVAPDFEGMIYAEVMDNTERTSGEWARKDNSNYDKTDAKITLILEDNPPYVSSIEDEGLEAKTNKLETREDNSEKVIYNNDVKFLFDINDALAIDKEKQYQSGLADVSVKINGDDYKNKVSVSKPVDGSIEITDYNGYFPHNYYDESGQRDRTKYSYVISTKDILADESGKYEVVVSAKDNAGNESEQKTVVYKDTAYPLITGFKFTPENNMDVEKDGNLYKVVEPTDYGFYFKKDVTVTISAKDYKQDNECASDVDTITYKAVDKNGKVVYSGTETVKDGKIEFKIDKDFKGQIYAYATDKVGNSPVNSISTKPEQAKKNYPTINKEGYVHPNGSVLETSKKHKETSSISFSVPKAQGKEDAFDTFKYKGKAQEDANMKKDNSSIFVPLYNADQTFGVTVADSYSGIRSVKYTIIEGKKQTVSEVIVDNDGKLDSKSETAGWSIKAKDQNLVTKMSKNIKVSGNYNNMVLLVELTDRAGNMSYDYYTFGIDKTAPKVDVVYNNNRADSTKFFKENRTATITVTERNFEEEDAKVKVTKNGKKQNVALDWKTVKGKDNQDDAKHIATIKYDKDGDYAFDISYKDNAKNVCKKVNYGKSVAPKTFTIDKKIPTIAVSFDNNSAKNGKYFNAYRTATVVVKEHNFDAGRVKFKQTASLNGKGTSIPSASWSSNGDIHTAKISFNADGDYTFDVTMSDKAGNNSNGISFGNSIAAKDFTIDTKIDKPSVSGVKNGSSYKGKVVPKITLNDVNYDRHEVKLTRTRMGEKNVDVTKEFMKAIGTNGHGRTSINDTFKKKAEVDGIYTLSVKMTDKAGNESSDKLMFTVNRFGSVYELDTYLADINDGYIQKVDSPLVITEYNADKLVEGSLNVQLTKDGALVKDVKYSVNPVANKKVKKGESGWYQYKYTIDASNFEKDGIYKLVISSKDEVGNKPETTNYKDSQITFRVDTTAPEITSIVGLEKAIVNAESQDVDFEVFDSIGLKSIKVYVDENEVKSIDKFAEGANCKGTIKLTEGANQNVRFLVEDLAGNVTDTNAESFEPSYEFNDDVTISTNFFVRWYANKLAFWGTIVGLIVVIGGVFFLILFKRRKDEEEKVQKTK